MRFNGDYYEIRINTKGHIETFFNHEKGKNNKHSQNQKTS